MEPRYLLRAIGLLGMVSAGVTAADRLPPESMLPGQAVKRSEFPAESALPDGFVSAKVRPQWAVRVPSERELPPRFASQTVASEPPGAAMLLAAADDDVARLDDSPDRTPWLRLDLGGHAATVRTLVFTPDSQRICSGGDDKSAVVWRRVAEPLPVQAPWTYERTIRWQIQRGPRGRIYALAAGNGLLALAGDGAMDQAKAVLADPATGQWRSALTDDRVATHPVVVSLAASPDPKAPGFVSVEIDGQAMYWSPDAATGLWKAREIQPPDSKSHGPAEAARLLAWRRFSPVQMTNGQTVVLPAYAGLDARGSVTWRLRSVDVSNGASRTLGGDGPDTVHTRMVLAMAVSADGGRLASADDAGRVFLWDLRRGERTNRIQMKAPVISLAFDASGQRLLLGGYRRDASGADLQLWDTRDVQQSKTTWSAKVGQHVMACAISPDGRDIAYSQGSTVEVRRLADLDRANVLRAAVRPPLRVAFARERPYYRVAFGYDADRWSGTFDATTLQLGREQQVDSKDWMLNTWWRGDWSLVTVPATTASNEETYWLAKAGRRVAQLPLRPGVEGSPTATCWIPDRQGQPLAVVVGTDGQNNLYVFRLAEQGGCPLLRMFRRHEAAVTSVGISRDLRYLVSAAQDMTIRFWPVGDAMIGDAVANRWGAEFAANEGRLTVTAVRADGPLYGRGVRAGDSIRKLMWREGGERISNDAPAEMLAALQDRPWQERLVFEHGRGGNLTGAFQIFPAWPPLASLLVAENRQWAYWAPSGYYDASFEGHRLFGWQVNRGLDRAPDFFLAAQLRRRLERPDVMSRLLETGSIEDAFRAARRQPPTHSQQVVQQEYSARPRLEIRQPHPNAPIAGDRVVVEAVITVPAGERLVPPKAFANGVVAGERELVGQHDTPDGQQWIYRWSARLPSDPQILIQVVASTEAAVVASAELLMSRAAVPEPRPARLFIAAAGVNQYRDAQIPRLDFAVRNALELTGALRAGAAPLYDSQAVSLLDQSVTRPAWSTTLDQYAADLARDVSPDDLLVIFLSGHGVRDTGTNDYYFVTADARFGDILGRRYADCLSFSDFAAFAEVPCRKLVILDTCHSGAVQPLHQRELKAALRLLQDDLVFTMTASDGSQEAVEARQRRLGRFTARLIEALQGAADRETGNGDGIVTLDEAVEYVQRMVAADSAADPQSQHPTAGPTSLLPLARLPLTGNRHRE
ncbi:MAG: caspase family protein [Pirellulaceae bacterium]|nr:caspase family protein [Pirellulaceae bacterium]